MLAGGIVVFLYGAISFAYATTNIGSAQRLCLQGKDPYAFITNQECKDEANSVFKPALVTVGSSFILIAIALFIRNFTTASVLEFTIEIILVTLGGWLLKINL